MNRLLIISLLPLILVFGLLLIRSIPIDPSPISCESLEELIEKQLVAKNYCETSFDCEPVSFAACPFGCYRLVNKAEETSSLLDKIENYRSLSCEKCIYNCIPLPESEEIKCINNKCVETRFQDITEITLSQ